MIDAPVVRITAAVLSTADPAEMVIDAVDDVPAIDDGRSPEMPPGICALLRLASAAVTNAVFAALVELSPAVTFGTVGAPVKVGDASGA